jgi:hypothetical protein
MKDADRSSKSSIFPRGCRPSTDSRLDGVFRPERAPAEAASFLSRTMAKLDWSTIMNIAAIKRP